MGTADTNQATSGLAGVSTAAPEVGSLAALSEKYKTGDEVAWKKEQQALASEPDWLDRLAYGMEAFGAGYKGQEPLYLKVRRQQMLEDQQRQETMLKLQQFKQQQNVAASKQVFDVFASDAPVETKLGLLQSLTDNPLVKNMAPLLNKQVLSIATPDVMAYLRPKRQQEIAILQQDPTYKPEGGWNAVEIELKDAAKRREEQIKTLASAEAKNTKYQQVVAQGKKRGWDTLDDADQQFLIDFKSEQADRAQKFSKVRQEIELGAAHLAEAKRPKTIEVQMGSQVVTLQETETGSGKWEPLTVGGKEVTGEKKPLVQIDMGVKASEEAASEYVKKAGETYQQLKSVPTLLKNIARAKELVADARGFMGTGGETLLGVAKFLNNRFGFRIDQKGITSAEVLQSRIFQNVMENLKKLDAQPSAIQQTIMMDALGRLGTDPSALPEMLDAYSDVLRDKVGAYNDEVRGAEKRGTRFPYDPTIKLPPPDYAPKLDFAPPKSWPRMDDKRKFEWLQRENKLSQHEATKYIAEH